MSLRGWQSLPYKVDFLCGSGCAGDIHRARGAGPHCMQPGCLSARCRHCQESWINSVDVGKEDLA